MSSEQSSGDLQLDPSDEANAELLQQVHPDDWPVPAGSERYNMVVVGAGTGGLVTAGAVAGLGGRVALIEKDLMGGDCLNYGCVPSKVLLRAARAAAEVRDADRYGVRIEGEVTVDFEAVMQRVRRVRAEISHHDAAERFAEELGVDVFFGHARFTGPSSLEVDGRSLDFHRACIATGSEPSVPSIEGIENTPYLTNKTLFELTDQPERMAILGAGAVGVEMAQAFARLGTEVVLIDIEEQILVEDLPEAARVIRAALVEDGVDVKTRTETRRVTYDERRRRFELVLEDGETVEADELLVATGRSPNVTELGLEEAGVAFDETGGIEVDDRLRTTNSAIYAVGDCATDYRYTHVAHFMARAAVRNALFFGRQKFSDLTIPWCLYTEPQLAHIGPRPAQFEDRGIDGEMVTEELADNDRAIIDGATEGFSRFCIDNKGRILAATVVGPHAGELIGEIAAAMHAGMTLDELGDVIHPYPTVGEAFQSAGVQQLRDKMSPTVATVLETFLRWRR